MNSQEEKMKRELRKINIAIDGHSSCGKSTTSKLLAKKLHYKYVDTGAMYRAVTYYLLKNSTGWRDEQALAKTLKRIDVDFKIDEEEGFRTLLNGEDVEDAIRTMEVSDHVSEVSTISIVRRKLVEQQQLIAVEKGVVMDGRDIGTVVLPNAEFKVFMTATIEARAMRRFSELKDRGTGITLDHVAVNLQNRDRIDSSRDDSPLRRADDAILLDTSDITIAEQTDWLYVQALTIINIGS